MDLTLRNGLVYRDGEITEVDVGISGSKIAAIGSLEPGATDLDLSNQLLLPGFVNAHAHASMTIFRGFADEYPFDEWLNERVLPVESELTEREIRIGAELAALEMIRTGTTAFGDMYLDSEIVAKVVEAAGLKAALGTVVFTDGRPKAEAKADITDVLDEARTLHGSADGRIRSLLTPHAPYSVDEWALEELAKASREIGCPTHIHLNETEREVAEYLDATGERPASRLAEIGYWDAPGYVAHGIHLSDAEIDILASADIGVAHCPAANMKLATGQAPVADLLQSGVRVGIGTDGAGSNNNLDMLEEMKLAALLGKHGESDASVLPPETVIKMATEHGADLLGFESGQIEEGRPADLVAVDLDSPQMQPTHDPLSHVVYSASGGDVRTTIVDGQVLYQDGEFQTLDQDRILNEMDHVLEFFDSVSNTQPS